MSTPKFCNQCGAKSKSDGSSYCAKCGAKLVDSAPMQKSDKSATTALLLCLFLGSLGIHRFYVGKIGTGLLMFFTAGGFGIWSLVDLIMIACGNFTDKDGRFLEFHRVSPSPLKLILTIVGLVMLAILIYVIFIISIVCYVTSGLTDPVKDQLTAMRSGNYQDAYSMTSSEFQQTVSFDEFKEFVNQYPVLRHNASSSFNNVKFENNTGVIKGTVAADNGASKEITYNMIKENGKWKILNIQMKASDAGISSDQKRTDKSEPVKKSDPNNISLPEKFISKDNSYSMNYPADWEYTQPDAWSVVFGGKKGTDAYDSTVNIQVILTKQSGGKYATLKEMLDSLKKQAVTQAKDTKFIAEDNIDLDKTANRMAMKGRYVVFTFTYDGKQYQQMQFVFLRNDGNAFYAWAYTSPLETYQIYYPVTQAMFRTWQVH